MPGNTTGKKRNNKMHMKLCVKCGKVLPLNDFYQHKDWVAQSYHDAWCKNCVSSFCTTKDALREYCWYNNRAWSDTYYEQAKRRSMYSLANDGEYLALNGKGAEAKRGILEERAACRGFLGIMNLASVYRYSNNMGDDSAFRPFDAESGAGAVAENSLGIEDGEQVFSREWNGYYTQREIDYLDDYYAQLEDGFVLDNQNIQDYARKAAKASLDADIKYNKMRQGQASASDWKEAQSIFDNLSKSANFAACRRRAGEGAGLGS